MSQGPLLYVDLRQFRNLAINLRAVEPEMHAAMRLRLRAAGMVVAEAARENAVSARLLSIAPNIRVQQSGLSVYVGVNRTPIAALEEYSPGPWEHPVFGNATNPQTQTAYPYLGPALQTKREEAVELIGTAVTEALDAAFKE
jgi:hypothetical protein